MKPKGCLAWAALILSLLGFFLMISFGLYVRKVMNSDFMTALERRAEAYPCIGNVLNPRRSGTRAEGHVARSYVIEGSMQGVPSIGWHFRVALTTWAIDVSTERDDANRLFAGLPTRRFTGFDEVARHYAGKSYCALDPARKQAVLDYYWHPREARIEQAMRPPR